MVSNVFLEDIEQIISSPELSWKKLENAAILITGATGLIGSILVRVLFAANVKYNLNMQILAHGRNAAKGEVLLQNYGVKFICSDIRQPFPTGLIADKVSYIFHCAAITKSADMVAKPVDVISTAIDGTQNILKLARENQTKSVIYLSSMEIYGQTMLNEVTESDLGYLDLANPRSSYPESKRLCENLCNAYFAQYGVPVKTARLAQVFGAGVARDDSRVFAQFARSAIAREDIVLHTEGKSRGNYCYISDAARGLLLLLLKGENGAAYNIANTDASVTIREMAEIVADKVCGGKISVIVKVPPDITKCGYAPTVDFKLNACKMKNLGWTPKYGLAKMYERMIADWRENE